MTTTRDTVIQFINPQNNLTRENSNILWAFNKTQTTEVSMEVG